MGAGEGRLVVTARALFVDPSLVRVSTCDCVFDPLFSIVLWEVVKCCSACFSRSCVIVRAVFRNTLRL